MRGYSRIFFRDADSKASFVGSLRVAIEALKKIGQALRWAAATGWYGETITAIREAHAILITELDKLAIALREHEICYQTEVEGLYTV